VSENVGAVAALATAAAWTVTALSFEYAGRRIGAFALNFLRLVVGFVLLGFWCLVTRGSFLPLDAPASAWIWLSASGLVGLVLGDLLLFQAFIDVGSRISMLVYASAPALAAALGYALFGEILGALAMGGMALTLAGIAIVVLGKDGRPEAAADPEVARPRGARPGSKRLRGIALAFGGSLGQAGGLILSKLGAGNMDPFAGTQIRVTAGMAAFGAIILVTGVWKGKVAALRDGKAIASLALGSFFGPFLGVSLSLLAVQSTQSGIAASIMSIVPVLIIAPSALINKERLKARDIIGSAVAVAGVFLLFLA
jgi:drug/metabolite transporter (DMT)-like permease